MTWYMPTLTVALAACIVIASSQSIQGADECTSAGGYTLCQNLAEDSGSGFVGEGQGIQMSTHFRSTPSSVEWGTDYEWKVEDFTTVKSFANVESNDAAGLRLDNLPTIAATWNWNYSSRAENMKSAVLFDIWLGHTPERNNGSSHEVQIWLSFTGGAKPIGERNATIYDLAEHDWELWRGTNGTTEVIIFSNPEGEDLSTFNEDMGSFFEYLVDKADIPKASCIQSIQAGTMVFGGRGTFHTSLYTLWIEYPDFEPAFPV
ncbi:concanavalin A-like lectin/glucanase [Coprinopsis marcescibilis]|uniref:Concanavalin A-like lectin/glucanase n=1 Tax=Coprinopsis marcescibilis TaxID=230819 RepID=A0A5C3KLS9_COPMA|nr:concanavalin A-like lectin/glucanase [Coprinopsis marcescibilis]